MQLAEQVAVVTENLGIKTALIGALADEMDASQNTASNAPHWQSKGQSHLERHPP
jgi:hypothetical protein